MKKAEKILWILFSIAILIVFVLHPRVFYAIMFFFCILQILLLSRNSDPSGKKPYHFAKHLLSNLLALFLIWWFFGIFFNIACPYHAPYEYKAEIQKFKSKKSSYDHFPDAIPSGAKKIKWVNLPSVLQGAGYEGLFFYADPAYLDSEYAKYLPQAKTTYHPIEREGETDAYFEQYFPMIYYIPDGTKKDVEVLILYDNGDWNHQRLYGLYLNRQEGYICYFNQ